MRLRSTTGFRFGRNVSGIMLLASAFVLAGCSRESGSGEANHQEAGVAPDIGFEMFSPRSIGDVVDGRPWITDLCIVDLDEDGLLDVVACEGKLNQILWLKQLASGQFEETIVGQPVQGPAHVEAIDFDGDGDQDLLVAGMGAILPNNHLIGSVVVMEQVGKGVFENRMILGKTTRVADAQAADLDGDGDLDITLAQFGYFQGEVSWLENQGDWVFERQKLLELSGSIHAPIADLDEDGMLDVVAIVSQEWEEVHLFTNRGDASFEGTILYGSSNEDYGSSGIALNDLDRDGDLDILYTNGDAFDYSRPGPRPWHGVQWLENQGEGAFRFNRLGSFAGAYSPIGADIDGDGDTDVIAVSCFNHWEKADAISLICFENEGKDGFVPRPLAGVPTHLVVVDAADMDGDGKIELVTGSFHAYPPYDRVAKVTLWDQ